RAGRVVGFGSGGAVQMYDRTALLSLLSLQGGLQGAPTAFWSDDGERAAKLPEFTGQVGVQLDDLSLWVATAMTVGSWSPQVLDEDDLASNSDRQAPSQQSVKAYVDDGDAQAELAASDYADQQIKSYLPPGVVMPYAGATAPTGWLLCFGQEVSRTTYADLFGVLSTTYGTGNGTTTFNLPDLRGRVVAGKDNMGGAAANRLTNSGTGNPGINGSVLGAAGGSDRHTLTVGQMPSHTHLSYGPGGAYGAGPYSARDVPTQTGSAGSSEAHPIIQPSIVLSYIIRS
ncbi:MAG: phage tail protein, partial [Verrucomicrobium sp.]